MANLIGPTGSTSLRFYRNSSVFTLMDGISQQSQQAQLVNQDQQTQLISLNSVGPIIPISITSSIMTPVSGSTGATGSTIVFKTGWLTATVLLTQDDIRTLNSANNRYGFKMMESAGLGTKIQISNPVLFLNHISGSVGDPNDTYIYDDSSLTNFYGYTNVFVDETWSGIGTHSNPIIEFAVMVDGWLGGNINSAPTGSRGTVTQPNASIFLWNSNDMPNFVGSGKIIFDYRILTSL